MSAPNPVERFVEQFAAGWQQPHPHAWDHLLADDLVLRQPLLPTRQGKQALAEEYRRLLRLLPDLTGQVTHWSATGSGPDATVDIHLELTATLGRRPLRLTLVDVCVLRDGLLAERTTYFDPTPAIARLATTPSAWLAWWRSGIGPLTSRRRLQDRTRSIPTALAAGRLAMGIPAWLAPSLSSRIYGFDKPHDPDTRYLVALYGARAVALGAGALLSQQQPRTGQIIALCVDTADTIAALRTDLPARTKLLSIAITGGYALAGAMALADHHGASTRLGPVPSDWRLVPDSPPGTRTPLLLGSRSPLRPGQLRDALVTAAAGPTAGRVLDALSRVARSRSIGRRVHAGRALYRAG